MVDAVAEFAWDAEERRYGHTWREMCKSIPLNVRIGLEELVRFVHLGEQHVSRDKLRRQDDCLQWSQEQPSSGAKLWLGVGCGKCVWCALVRARSSTSPGPQQVRKRLANCEAKEKAHGPEMKRCGAESWVDVDGASGRGWPLAWIDAPLPRLVS